MPNKSQNLPIEVADISWSDGLPLSTRFDDVYYSRDDGLKESRHVFIDGNRLQQRWSTLTEHSFRIFETGFGTGLNFLCAVDLWLKLAPADARLDYVSVEKYPLTNTEIRQALAAWPELHNLADKLATAYPPPVRGIHRLALFADRVTLTLIFDDAVTGFGSLLASSHPAFIDQQNPVADAWFLDGFSPAKNPDLWSSELFQLMGKFSGSNTSFATFTVARLVRDGLGNAGFSWEKRPGYGRKRDMLCGHFSQAKPAAANSEWIAPKILRNSPHESTWHLRPSSDHCSTPDNYPHEAVVIGAGIAGCATAAALKKRGWRVTVLDRHPQPGQEASGNAQGILYPKLSQEESPLPLFGRHALCHASHYYRPYWQTGLPGKPCGVLVLPENQQQQNQFADIVRCFGNAQDLVQHVKGQQLSELAGIALAASEGLYFPQLGWVQPPAVCRWLSEGIAYIQGQANSLERDEHNQRWQILDSNRTLLASASVVIVACSYHSNRFAQCQHLPLRPIRGQISAIPATAQSQQLQTVICGAGYIAPALQGLHTLGATYDVDDTSLTLRQEDHQRNLKTLADTDSALPEILATSILDCAAASDQVAPGGRAGIRCTTPDYLPIAGPAPDLAAFNARFRDFSRNGKADIPLPGCYLPGLWLNCGHGSRGLTYAPMVAELLAAQLNNEPPPLPRSLVMALNPARFIIRNLKRAQ